MPELRRRTVISCFSVIHIQQQKSLTVHVCLLDSDTLLKPLAHLPAHERSHYRLNSQGVVVMIANAFF